MTIPSKILHSSTAGNKPASLVTGQLAINEADRELYYLDPTTTLPSSLLSQAIALNPNSNLIINGAMEVDQINRGNSLAFTTGTSGYAVDMLQVAQSGASALSTQQIADAPVGLGKSVKVSITTANASPGSTDYVRLSMPLEGYRVQRLLFGAATALNIAGGFWAKANRPGIYGFNISNAANNRGYSTSFTIASQGVWQYFSFSIPGDITGTWVSNNAKSILLSWFIMAGSGLLAAANTWGTIGAQGVSGQINGAQATSDFFEITGVSLFPGYVYPTAARSLFLNRSFDHELELCKRYLQKSYDYEAALAAATTAGIIQFSLNSGSAGWNVVMSARFPVSMMADPTVTIYSPNSGATGKMYDAVPAADLTATVTTVGQNGVNVVSNATTGSGYNLEWHFSADARM